MYRLSIIMLALLVPCLLPAGASAAGSRSAHPAAAADPAGPIDLRADTRPGEPPANDEDIAAGRAGPTLTMRYTRDNSRSNPVAHFMYFVPLIAVTRVDSVLSADNQQQVAIISHTMTADSDSFHVRCEIEITGHGSHTNNFEPPGIIAAAVDDVEEGEPLTNLLEYIKVEGGGLSAVEVRGRIADSRMTVTEVDVRFDARREKSPVTIGLYDIEPQNGAYHYENRSNPVVARVRTLAFKRTEQTPTMEIEVASVAGENGSDGLFGRIRGAIANLFIKPNKIDALGNNAMLEFGEALLHRRPEFTFPKAENLATQ